ncbi:hypothetical protein Nepgr_026671 [Nepenthes gracilis]|uniref:Uncharacterized protein n=1 Tax=Nepenthes gracilis TaxID=150966 RepID=A0AAD3T7L5_NEPGR|nr:hypothetical protein Nepgr_026671 [Nepenthes gracilis]
MSCGGSVSWALSTGVVWMTADGLWLSAGNLVDSVLIVSFAEFGSLVLTGTLLVSACSLTPLFFLRCHWVWPSVQKCFGSFAASVDGGSLGVNGPLVADGYFEAVNGVPILLLYGGIYACF